MRATWQSQVRAEPAVGVEAVPEPQRALERDGGEILGGEPVRREPRQVAVHVVEVRLRGLLKRHLTCCTPPVDDLSRTFNVRRDL